MGDIWRVVFICNIYPHSSRQTLIIIPCATLHKLPDKTNIVLSQLYLVYDAGLSLDAILTEHKTMSSKHVHYIYAYCTYVRIY